MKRADAIKAMEAAGAANDSRAFTRLLIENRVSRPVAKAAWDKGANLRRFCEARDAADTPN